VTKFDPTGNHLEYSTYLGGTGWSANDLALGVALDTATNAYVTGETSSSNFPVSAGALKSVLSKSEAIESITRAAAAVVTWTGHGLNTGDFVGFIGITQAEWTILNEQPFQITRINANSFSIPLDTSAFAAAYNAADPGVIFSYLGSSNAFVTRLNADGTMGYSTYLGAALFSLSRHPALRWTPPTPMWPGPPMLPTSDHSWGLSNYLERV
jgi:hypothetical protein